MHGDDEQRISGRRSVDDGARLLIAENSLLRIEEKVSTLAEGLGVTSGILIGRPLDDGTVTVGLVHRVDGVREKQEESGIKLDALNADMGDLKTAQAEQALTLAEHGTALARIEKWFALGVGYLKSGAAWIARGVLGALGLGALHEFFTVWWPAIVLFFSAWGPAASTAASAASKGHGH